MTDKLLKIIETDPIARRYLTDNYSGGEQRSATIGRYSTLIRLFQTEFGEKPRIALRAPGRVNLLGGHTDYNGCPVIPIAIDRDIVGALSGRDDAQIVLVNTEPRFSKRMFSVEPEIPPYPTGDWGNYVKAAIQGLVTHFRQSEQELRKGFNMAVSGSVPPAAGMASSSALVVLAAIAFLTVNEREMDRLQLARLLAQAEWYVGTQGGGMDQAISLLGQSGHALKIEFNPYSTLPVAMPKGYRAIVTHSLVFAPKTESAMDKYNRRPIECRLAVALIRQHLSQQLHRSVDVRLIGDLKPELLGMPDDEIYRICLDALPDNRYSYASISNTLNESIEQIQKKYCLKKDGTVFDEPLDGFKLRSRFTHIFTEWKRVLKAVDILKRGEMLIFGELMNEAQVSCRENYEISVPEIDQLVQISLKNGAMGARLTGAGFGGCVVNLVPQENAETFKENMGKYYYQDFARHLLPEGSHWRNFVLDCKSVDGAGEVLFSKYI